MLRTPTCPICLQNYGFQDRQPLGSVTPLNLSCSHTFCEGCLVKKVSDKKELECPICQEKTFLAVAGSAGVRELMPNIYLLGYLALNKRLGNISTHSGSPLAKFKGVPLAQKQTWQEESTTGAEESIENSGNELCEQCLTEVATCQCKSCDYCRFCATCFGQVHKSAKLSKHQQLPLDLRSEQAQECIVHIGRPLEFFDKDLDEPICALCLISDKHKGHNIMKTEDLEFSLSSSFAEDISKAKEQLTILEYSKTVVQKSMSEVTMEANRIIQDIQAHFIALHALLQRRELNLLDTALQNIAEDSSLDQMYQELIGTHKQLSAAIKEGEKLRNEKLVGRKKQDAVREKLLGIKDTPCFAERRKEKEGAAMSFHVEQSHLDMLDEIGSIRVKSSRIINLKTLAEKSEEDLALAKSDFDAEAPLNITNLKLLEYMQTDTVDPSGFTLPESKIIHAMRASYERVYVTDIRSPTDFSIQRLSDKERLQNMMRAINNYCRQSDKSSDLVMSTRKGDLVLSQFTKDNNWYRAVVVNEKAPNSQGLTATLENGLLVEVHYVDYGNKEWVPLARMRCMKEEFLDVPELAVSCSLCDIVPPRKQEKWPRTTIDAFTSLVGEGILLMNVRYRLEGRLFVDLRKADDDEPTPDEDRPVSTRDALVFLEVACFRSEYSAPNQGVCKPNRVFKDLPCPQPGEMLDVIVSFVGHPKSIFVQRLDNVTTPIEKDLKKLYSGRGKDAGKILYPYRNLVCAAKFSEDKKWYRALIKAVNENNTVSVLYVDFGNSETVKFSDLRKLPDTWLSIPKQAMEVQLADVGMFEGETEWSDKVIKFLTDKIANRPLVMIVQDCEDSRLPSVRLCDTSTDRDIYIAPLLVYEGLVMSVGPSSDPVTIETALVVDRTTKEQTDVAEKEEKGPLSLSLKDAKVPTAPLEPTKTYSYIQVNPGEGLDLVGVYVDDECRIYAHRVSDTNNLAMIMETINRGDDQGFKGLSKPKATSLLQSNQPCLAKYALDDNWYRAVVLAVVDEEQVEVDFVDFGNRELVPLDAIQVPGPFLDVPRQAISLEIDKIIPKSENGRWPQEVVAFLREQVENQELTAVCSGSSGENNTIKASLTSTDGMDLSKLLIKEDMAVPSPSVITGTSLKANCTTDEMEVRYGMCALPEIGVEFDVIVTQVEKENLIVMQRLPQTENEGMMSMGEDETRIEATFQINRLAEFSEQINKPEFFTEKSKLTLDDIVVGMPCCVKDKNDGRWYRAKIKQLNKTEKGARMTVLYVDYGLSDVVDINWVRKIPRNIAQLPCQGIFGRISGIQLAPTSNADDKRKMLIAAMKDLYISVANKRLVAVILERGPIPSVALLERILLADREPCETKDTYVGEIMAKLGHVTFEPPNLLARQSSEKQEEDVSREEIQSDEKPGAAMEVLSTRMMELPQNSDPQKGP